MTNLEHYKFLRNVLLLNYLSIYNIRLSRQICFCHYCSFKMRNIKRKTIYVIHLVLLFAYFCSYFLSVRKCKLHILCRNSYEDMKVCMK